MKTQRSADIASGLFLAALGLLVIIAAMSIQAAFAERLPPRTLPVVLGCVTIVTGLLLAYRAWRFKGQDPAIDWPDKEGWKRVLVGFGSLVVYLVLIDPIGMPLATLIFTSFLIWYLDRRVVRSVVIGVITAAIILFVFIRILELTFPVGPLHW